MMKTIKILLFIFAIFIASASFVNAGSGAGSVTVTVNNPPSSPTNFKATAGACGTSKIDLSWTASSGATGYSIKDNGSDIPVTITGTTFTVSSVAAGSSHVYTIAAQSSGGSSAYVTASPNPAIGPSACPFTVTSSATAGGTITPASQSVSPGATAVFNVTPISTTGYKTTVTGCNGTLAPFNNPGTTYTTGAINANCAVSAVFTPNAYTVTGSAGSGGTISPASQSINSGYKATVTVTPNTGYGISSISGCGGTSVSYGNSGGNFSLSYLSGAINSACTISATFHLMEYTVYGVANSGGSISPATRTVSRGSSTTFTVASNSGYSISSVTGCGGSLSGNTYTTGAITGECSVVASFSPNTTGSIGSSIPSCRIADGQSSCSMYIGYGVMYPVPGAATNITKPTNVQVLSITPAVSGQQTLTGANISVAVSYPNTTFYLNHNGSTLDSLNLIAVCNPDTSSWDSASGTCKKTSSPINGSCSSTHYVCSAGSSVNNSSSTNSKTTTYTWNCNGINGGTNSSQCSESVVMSGTITPTSPSCTIASGSSSCNANISWSTNNPQATSAVTSNYPSSNTTVFSGNSGNNQQVTIPYSSRTFYLYNNAIQLASSVATASCTSGNSWDAATGKCKPSACSNGANNPPTCSTFDSCSNGANNPPTCTTFTPCANGATNPPSCTTFTPCSNGANNPPTCTTFTPCANGANNPPTCTTFDPCSNGAINPPACDAFPGTTYITASNCEISKGNTSCSSSLDWNITPATGTFGVTTPTNITIASTASGSATYPVTFGTRDFYLYNSGNLKDQATATASCTSGTTWGGMTSGCIINNNPVDGGWRDLLCDPCDATGHRVCTRVCDNPTPSGGGADCVGSTTYTNFCTFGGSGSGVLNINFTASPNKIFKGKSSILTWTSDADSCTLATDKGVSIDIGNSANGTVTVNPSATTTYTLSCKGAANEEATQQVKVSSITVIER